MNDCIFCRIAAGELPRYTVFEDTETVAFLSNQPNKQGHTVVIPKKHFRNIFDIDDEALTAVAQTSKKVAHALMQCGLAEGVNVISNNESAAGQAVFHAHTHVIPRHENDKILTWIHTEYGPGEAEEIINIIKKAL